MFELCRVGPERVGRENLRARVSGGAMNLLNETRISQHELVKAAAVHDSFGREGLEHGAHRPVTQQWSLSQTIEKWLAHSHALRRVLLARFTYSLLGARQRWRAACGSIIQLHDLSVSWVTRFRSPALAPAASASTA